VRAQINAECCCVADSPLATCSCLERTGKLCQSLPQAAAAAAVLARLNAATAEAMLLCCLPVLPLLALLLPPPLLAGAAPATKEDRTSTAEKSSW
jgi:hypothetical protein